MRPKNGQHDLGRLLEDRTVGALHRHRTELAALPVELGDLTELEADVALLDEGEHLLHRSGRRAELGAPMQQGQRLGDRLQVQGPIERRVAAADDEHVAAPEMLHLAHRIEHRSAFILLDAGKRRALRREGSAAGGNHHHLGFKHGIRVGLQPEAAVEALETLNPLVEVEGGSERLDLVHELVGQLLAGDDGQPGNVVDRLLGIELGALAPGAIENVDDMAFDVD